MCCDYVMVSQCCLGVLMADHQHNPDIDFQSIWTLLIWVVFIEQSNCTTRPQNWGPQSSCACCETQRACDGDRRHFKHAAWQMTDSPSILITLQRTTHRAVTGPLPIFNRKPRGYCSPDFCHPVLTETCQQQNLLCSIVFFEDSFVLKLPSNSCLDLLLLVCFVCVVCPL